MRNVKSVVVGNIQFFQACPYQYLKDFNSDINLAASTGILTDVEPC